MDVTSSWWNQTPEQHEANRRRFSLLDSNFGPLDDRDIPGAIAALAGKATTWKIAAIRNGVRGEFIVRFHGTTPETAMVTLGLWDTATTPVRITSRTCVEVSRG